MYSTLRQHTGKSGRHDHSLSAEALMMGVIGAHTLGRVKPSRSGFGKEKTKYTENGPGTPGGSSWTAEWLKFDNSYFKARPP